MKQAKKARIAPGPILLLCCNASMKQADLENWDLLFQLIQALFDSFLGFLFGIRPVYVLPLAH